MSYKFVRAAGSKFGWLCLTSAFMGIATSTVAQPAATTTRQNAPVSVPTGEPQTAPQLFLQLATLDSLEASFVETKKLTLLRAPLTSTGSLYYLKPGYLLREIETPSRSRVLITPNALELTDAQGKRSIDLRARPDVKLFVESFTKVLAGDEAALAKGFDMRFTPRPPQMGSAPSGASKDEWTLILVPKAAPLSHLIKQLELTGRGYAVERIRIVETKGDTSDVVLTVKSVGRTYSTDERLRLFGLKDTVQARP